MKIRSFGLSTASHAIIPANTPQEIAAIPISVSTPIANIPAGSPNAALLTFIQGAQIALQNTPAGWTSGTFNDPVSGEGFNVSGTLSNFSLVGNSNEYATNIQCAQLPYINGAWANWPINSLVTEPSTGNIYTVQTNITTPNCMNKQYQITLNSLGSSGPVLNSPITNIAEGNPVTTVAPGVPLNLTATVITASQNSFLNQYGVYLAVGAVISLLLFMVLNKTKRGALS